MEEEELLKRKTLMYSALIVLIAIGTLALYWLTRTYVLLSTETIKTEVEIAANGTTIIPLDNVLLGINENNFRMLQVKLDISGSMFLYPFCVVNESGDNAYVTIYEDSEKVIDNFYIENGMKVLWQFEKGTNLVVDVFRGDWVNSFEVPIPYDEDSVYWIIVTEDNVKQELRPITDKGELASGYALGLDFGTIGVPPREYTTNFEEMNTADDLRNDGWIVMDSNAYCYLEELSFPITDRGKSLYFRTYGWWYYPLVLTPEWTGEVEYEFVWKPDNRYYGEIIFPLWLITGVDSNGNELWYGFFVRTNSYGKCARYYNVEGDYYVYVFAGGSTSEITNDYLLNNWHTIKISWTRDNILSFTFDDRFSQSFKTILWNYYRSTGTWTSIPQSPIGSKYRLALFDGAYSYWLNKGAYYDFSIKELGLPPARPIMILPSIENFHLVGSEWRANYNLILTTNMENVDNVHSFYVSKEQVLAILKNKMLYLKNYSKYPIDVDVEIKVAYAAIKKRTRV